MMYLRNDNKLEKRPFDVLNVKDSFGVEPTLGFLMCHITNFVNEVARNPQHQLQGLSSHQVEVVVRSFSSR